MNLPNFLTGFRIIAAFVFLYYGLQNRWDYAFPLFCLAAFTDMVDGTIARLLRQRTRLGAFLDPMADKLLMFFGFLTLSIHHIIPWVLTSLMIARDLLIVGGLGFLKYKKVKILYRPTYLSKATTFFQIMTLGSALLSTQNFPQVRDSWLHFFIRWLPATMVIAGAFTLITGVQYTRIGLWMLRHEKN